MSNYSTNYTHLTPQRYPSHPSNASEELHYPLESYSKEALNQRPVSQEKKPSIIAVIWVPLACLVGAVVIGIAHHEMNTVLNGKELVQAALPQIWVVRFATWMALGFQIAMVSAMGFVLCQLVWYYTQTKFLSIGEIDTLYAIQQRNVKSIFLSKAFMFGPLLVVVAVLTMGLPLVSGFTPSSLTVATVKDVDVPDTCNVPSGDWTTPESPNANLLHFEPGVASAGANRGKLGQATKFAELVATRAMIARTLPTFPNVCGANCTYATTTQSIVYDCSKELPDQVPAAGSNITVSSTTTIWSANDTSPVPGLGRIFQIGWRSTTNGNGTAGAMECTAYQGLYTFRVRDDNGKQTVTYDVALNGTLPAGVDEGDSSHAGVMAQQLEAILRAVFTLFRPSDSVDPSIISTLMPHNQMDYADPTNLAGSSFLEINHDSSSTSAWEYYTWGDVRTGVEQLAANATAQFLMLGFGTVPAPCVKDQFRIIYVYNSRLLFEAYGAALVVVLLWVVFAIWIVVNMNPTGLTTSFSNTLSITSGTHAKLRPSYPSTFAEDNEGVRLRLGNLPSGLPGFSSF